MQADSYLNSYPTSIRISRDFSSTSHDQDIVDRDSLSTFTLTEDANITEIAPWAANDSEPVRILFYLLVRTPNVWDFVFGLSGRTSYSAGSRALVFVRERRCLRPATMYLPVRSTPRLRSDWSHG